MTLKIYGVLRSRASRVVWLAKELGIPFEHVPVIQAYRLPEPDAPDAPFNTATRAFRRINPNGLIPSIDDDGLILHESLAINLYLARKHGGAVGPRDLAEEGQAAMWSLWAATECEPHTISILLNRGQRSGDDAKALSSVMQLHRPVGVLDDALERGDGYLVGKRFTVADLNVAEIFRYAQGAPELFRDSPCVRLWLAACQARPAYKAMMAARNEEPA